MALIKLFLAFLKIGAFTFGGGYAMIAMIRGRFLYIPMEFTLFNVNKSKHAFHKPHGARVFEYSL